MADEACDNRITWIIYMLYGSTALGWLLKAGLLFCFAAAHLADIVILPRRPGQSIPGIFIFLGRSGSARLHIVVYWTSVRGEVPRDLWARLRMLNRVGRHDDARHDGEFALSDLAHTAVGCAARKANGDAATLPELSQRGPPLVAPETFNGQVALQSLAKADADGPSTLGNAATCRDQKLSLTKILSLLMRAELNSDDPDCWWDLASGRPRFPTDSGTASSARFLKLLLAECEDYPADFGGAPTWIIDKQINAFIGYHRPERAAFNANGTRSANSMGNILASAYSRMLGGTRPGDACPLMENTKRAYFPLEQFHDEQLPDNFRAADLQQSRASFLAASNTYWPILASEEDEAGWGPAGQGKEVGGTPDQLRKAVMSAWKGQSSAAAARAASWTPAQVSIGADLGEPTTTETHTAAQAMTRAAAK